MLPDIYANSGMGSIYLGKDITSAPALLPYYDVEGLDEHRLALRTLKKINDRVKKKSMAKAKQGSKNPAGKPPRV